MGLLPFIWQAMVYAMVLVIDLAFLFAIVRVIGLARTWPGLAALDHVGRPLLDALARLVARGWNRLGGSGVLSERQRMVIVLIALGVVRLVLTGMAGFTLKIEQAAY